MLIKNKLFNKGHKYNVKINHFYCLEYSENDHVMNVEIDFRDPIPVLSIKTIESWNPPYDNEEISESKKQIIFENIYGYLTQNGFSQIDIEK